MTPNAMAFKQATETPAADARFKQGRPFVMFNKASVQKAIPKTNPDEFLASFFAP